VVVGDNYVYATFPGFLDWSVGGDSRIAGQNHFGSVLDVAFEVLPVHAVGLSLTVGDVIVHIGAEFAQGSDEKGRGRLSVYIKVAPDQNPLFLLDG
jgi:hypothetical protein